MDDVEILIKGNMCIAPKIVRAKMLMASPSLEGRRKWLNTGQFSFENTKYNRGIIEDTLGSVVFNDAEADKPLPAPFPTPEIVFSPPTENFDHQNTFFDMFKDRKTIALFAEMGTGKTKMGIDVMNRNFTLGRISGVIVLAKKGVHNQWIDGEEDEFGELEPSPIEKHTQSDLPFIGQAWSGKKIDPNLLKRGDSLKWYSVNFDAVIHKRALAEVMKFVEAHKGSLGFIGDETHYLKSHKARRTMAAIKIASHAQVKMIMTGTPIAKNLVDEWSQFKVLNEDIIGHRYLTTFRNEFCVMGGFEGRSVVGAKNLTRFKTLTEPHCYRVLKSDCMDLPEKQYHLEKFNLTTEQKTKIAMLKATQSYMREDGVEVLYDQPITILSKVQEISNGFFTDNSDPEKPYVEFFANPRMKALNEFVDGNEGKHLIWARYQWDIKLIQKNFGERAMTYYGANSTQERKEAKGAFMSPNSGVDFLVLTAAAGGEGIDGLQKASSTAIYYSNSFNSLHRWQSEDRIHRIGMMGSADYVDLVARGCVDYSLLSNLKAKKDFSHMVLDMANDFGISTRGIGIPQEPDEFEIVEKDITVTKDNTGMWENF